MSALRFWDRKRLDLHAAVVMPDHVHALFTPRARVDRPGAFENLSALLKSIKGFSGREISQRRCDSGEGWVHESYDRWIRNEADFAEKWNYLADNVVKEGLAPTPGEYRWWYAVDYFGRGIGRPVSPETPLPPVLGGTLAESAGDSTAGTEGGAASSCKAELCTPRHRGGSTRICVFIKHTNACGVGTAHAADDSSQGTVAARVEAYRRAYLGDPNAAMGGILAVNFPVDAEFAATVMEAYARFGKPLRNAGPAGPAHPNPPGAFFIEVWIAPRFTDDAVAVIRGTYDPDQASPDEAVGETILDSPPPKKDWGKRVRLLAVGDMAAEPDAGEMDLRKIAGGVLMQTPDLPGLNEDQWKVVTKRAPDEREMSDLRLAWLVCKHTKSNAITLCRDGMLIGNGAGQMSRVMSCRIATWLARENGHMGGNREQGTGNGEEGTGNGNRRSDEQGHSPVAASDAFFPFRDGVDVLIEAGVSAIIQPGGSKRDAEVIAACDERDVAMIFTGTRHFRH
jgi:REP element-mobilizing transposase RayT